jgi:hypothetical protein
LEIFISFARGEWSRYVDGRTSFSTLSDVRIKMSQRDLVLALRAQGKSATAIRQHLVEAFGELAVSCATVSRTIGSLSWHPIDDESQNLGRQPPNQLIEARILQILDDNPGVSVRETARAASIPVPTAEYLLTTRLGYTWRKSHNRPHTLSNSQRQQRLEQSQLLLINLRKAQHNAWRFC